MRRLILLVTPAILALACDEGPTTLGPPSPIADEPVQTAADLPPAAPNATARPAEAAAPAAPTPIPPTETRPVDRRAATAPERDPGYGDVEAEVPAVATVLRYPALPRVAPEYEEDTDRGDVEPDLTTRGTREPDLTDRGDVEDDLVDWGDREPDLTDRGDVEPDLTTRGEAQPAYSGGNTP